LSFTNTNGVLSDFKISLDEDDLASMAGAGVVVSAGPYIVWADPIARNFEFVYNVTSGGVAFRYILDNYYQP
jgi:hypothetical protein